MISPSRDAAPRAAFRARRSAALLLGTALLVAVPPLGAASLAEVYARARDHDATLRAARAEHAAALTQLPIARSTLLPQLGLGAEANIGYVDPDGADDDRYEDSALSLSATQTLFNASNRALVRQARVGVRRADAQLLAARQGLIRRVAAAYFEVLRAEANLEFSRSELEAIERQREQAERRFDVGLVPITDVRSAQAQFDLAVAQEIAASNALSTAREALRVISGIDAERLAPLADDLPLASPDPADIDAWVELATEQNLALVDARLAAESARTQIAVERGARYPTVDLVGSASSARTNQFGRSDTELAELGLQLTLPLYTGGRISAQVAQAQANTDAATERLVAEERAAVQQARDGYRGVEASISRVRALRQALVSTQQSADAIEAGFRAGTRTSIDVLEALRDVFRARSDYAGARYDYILNTLELKAAAGTLDEGDIAAIERFLIPVERLSGEGEDEEAGGNR